MSKEIERFCIMFHLHAGSTNVQEMSKFVVEWVCYTFLRSDLDHSIEELKMSTRYEGSRGNDLFNPFRV